MTDLPKTPTRAARIDRKAPTLKSPGTSLNTPKSTRIKGRSHVAQAKGALSPGDRVIPDENRPINSSSRRRDALNKDSATPRVQKPAVHSKPQAKRDDSGKLKVQSSRDAAELLALLDTSSSMKVIEVPPDVCIDENAFRELVQHKVPVVFRSYASEWKCVKNWSKPGYLKRAAEEEEKTLPHRKYRRFVAQSKEKGRLHLTDGKSKAKAVTINEFLASTESTTNDDGLYMLGIHSVGHSHLSYCPVQSHKDDGDDSPPLARDVPSKVDILEWYARILAKQQDQETPIRYDHQQFFLAKGYAFTDLHYDSYDNFYVAVSGQRRWTLACPQASRWLISSTGGKLKSGSLLIPHLNDYPAGSPAQLYPFSYVDLCPGDVLFVPDCWWHLVESIPGTGSFSCAFNFFFSKPPDRVFEDFQTCLADTDSVVNRMQSVCRKNLAAAKDTSSPDAIPQTIKNPPAGIPREIWDQFLQFVVCNNAIQQAVRLHMQHTNNSIERWAPRNLEPPQKPEAQSTSEEKSESSRRMRTNRAKTGDCN